MADQPESGGGKKTDWSRTNAILNKDAVNRGELIMPPPPPRGLATTQSAIDVPEMSAPQGILSEFKANRIKRKAAMAALQTHYDNQLDVLAHTLSKAALVEKSRADVTADHFLKELDAQHLEVLAELGMRNKQTREQSLIDLTEQTCQRIREVQEKDWPPQLVEETLQQLLGLRKRYIAEILAELGSAYEKE